MLSSFMQFKDTCKNHTPSVSLTLRDSAVSYLGISASVFTSGLMSHVITALHCIYPQSWPKHLHLCLLLAIQ